MDFLQSTLAGLDQTDFLIPDKGAEVLYYDNPQTTSPRISSGPGPNHGVSARDHLGDSEIEPNLPPFGVAVRMVFLFARRGVHVQAHEHLPQTRRASW